MSSKKKTTLVPTAQKVLTGKDVGVSVLLLVVVLVGLLVRPDGTTAWQELQNKNTVRFYTVLKDSQTGWLLAAHVNCVLLHVFVRHFLCYLQ